MTGRPSLSAALAAQALARSLDGVLAFDRQYRYICWNPAMERIWGISAPDALGQVAFELFPFLRDIGEDELFRRALAGQSVVSRDRPFEIPGTGRHGFFEGHYAPLRDEQNAVVGGVCVVRDVTEQKRAERQLEETESRFRNMADVSPVMLWMSGTDGLCTFFNQTWLRFTGRTLAEEWGVGWAENVHFEDFQRCMDTYLDAFGERRVLEMEYRLRRADGEYRWILDRGTPRYSQDGTFAGYIGSCIDITERRQLEVDLRAAVRVRDEFLSIASHELRTPLTAMQLQADALERVLRRRPDEALRSGRLAEAVSGVGSQVARMAELVEALLDVSRITSGHLELALGDVDLCALATGTVDRWRALALAAGSALDLQADGAVSGRWDRLRLEQVLNNLLSNALKYGRGKPVTVRVRGDADQAVAILEVSDRGIGISELDQRRIFERFERAVSPRNYGGLGLGLWIARQIVEAMRGSIGVTSAPGAGATFRVTLPAAPKQHATP